MIKVEGLSKSFGDKKAVDNVTFEVSKGEVLGFLGPNGAGKSTTMRMITGFYPPTAGKISVCGFDVVENPISAKEKIGYLPEAAPSYQEMSVLSFLKFAAEMRGLSGEAKRQAIRRVVETCHLEGVLGQTIDTLSKGFKHRTCLAQSIIHDPEVLVLDEPTDGLDPNQKHEVRSLIKRMGENKAIIFSTHILEEVEAVCSRAIIIDRGRIVANGTPDELKARSARAGVAVVTVSGTSADQIKEKCASIASIEKVEILSSVDGAVKFEAFPRSGSGEETKALAARIAELAIRENWRIEGLRTEEGRLEEVFRSITMPDTHAIQGGRR
jgi:ABC-2 type transport system ATP-binding protein